MCISFAKLTELLSLFYQVNNAKEIINCDITENINFVPIIGRNT